MAESSGNLIAAQRARLGLKTSALARMLDVSQQTIWNWEHDRGVPSVDRIADLSAILGVEASALIEWIGQQMVRVAMAKRGVA